MADDLDEAAANWEEVKELLAEDRDDIAVDFEAVKAAPTLAFRLIEDDLAEV